MAWKYDIPTGNMYTPQGERLATCYSGGNCGANPDGVNNPSMMGVKCIGPIPVGRYTFGAPVEHSKLGAFAIPLIPDPSSDMLGRGEFYCHGDVVGKFQSASEGCIVAPPTTRHAMIDSGDHQLDVVNGVAP